MTDGGNQSETSHRSVGSRRSLWGDTEGLEGQEGPVLGTESWRRTGAGSHEGSWDRRRTGRRIGRTAKQVVPHYYHGHRYRGMRDLLRGPSGRSRPLAVRVLSQGGTEKVRTETSRGREDTGVDPW